jgi:Tfp pilus assembly protein FimT
MWIYVMKTRQGYSLVELVVIVLILAALAFVAVPRLQFGALHRQQADTVARKIATDLRLTRTLAITDAVTNTDGFALNMIGSSPFTGYQIVDLSDSSVIDSHTIDSVISCTGGGKFEFGPLGNLKDGSDTQLSVSAEEKTFTITVVTATGTVKLVEN